MNGNALPGGARAAWALFLSPNLPNLWIARGVVATGNSNEARRCNDEISADPERRTVLV